MGKSFYGKWFRFVRSVFRIFWPTHKVVNPEKLIEGALYISHHQNQYGPYTMLSNLPMEVHLWTFHPFCGQKTAYRQYMDYTFTVRLGWNKVFAAMVAFPMSHLIGSIVKSYQGIPVYRDSRAIKTFKMTVEALKKGESVLLFADIDYTSESNEMGEMYKGFLLTDKFYHRATGKRIPFVPMLAHKDTKEIIVGDPIYFTGTKSQQEETDYIYHEIQKQMNILAKQK